MTIRKARSGSLLVILLFIAAGLPLALFTITSDPVEADTHWTPDDLIVINGDADFTAPSGLMVGD